MGMTHTESSKVDRGPRRRGGTAVWAVATALLLAGAEASGAAFTESGDAGSSIATAQLTATTGPVTLDSISGTIGTTSDRDLYQIYITGDGTFSATTVGLPGTIFDTQLFLFDYKGAGVVANDDDPSGEGSSRARSTITGSSLAAGLYYLLIDVSGSYPTSPSGLIFPNYITDASAEFDMVGPTGPGGGLLLTGYSGTGAETGTYTIALTGAVAAPEPGTLALMLIGGPALALAYRLRRREA